MPKNTGRNPHSHENHTPWAEVKKRGGAFGKRSWNDRFTDWYDRQSIEIIFLLACSPLMLIGIVLITCALMWG